MKLLQQLSPDKSEAQNSLQFFAQKLLKNIELVIQRQDGAEALRQVLKKGLEDIYQTFNLVPLDKLLESPVPDPSQLRPSYKGALRFIERSSFL